MFIKYARLWFTLAFLISLYLFADIFGLREFLSLAYIQTSFNNHFWLGVVIFSALFALGNLIQIPGWIFLAAAVLALGKLCGGLVTYIAAVFACCVTYGVIRVMGGAALRELKTPLAQRLLARLDAHPLQTLVLLRCIFQTAPPLNYTLALAGVTFRPYLLGTLLGLPLPIATYCVLFDFLKTSLL